MPFTCIDTGTGKTQFMGQLQHCVKQLFWLRFTGYSVESSSSDTRINKHQKIRCQRLPRISTLYVLNIFIGNTKTCQKFIIPPQWHGAGSCNPSSCNTTYLFHIVNNMGANVLATQGARASTIMVLAMLKRNNWVPARWGLMSSLTWHHGTNNGR